MIKLTEFKRESIEKVVIGVRDEIGCSLMEAVTKLQSICVINGNEGLLNDLCSYKWELIEAM